MTVAGSPVRIRRRFLAVIGASFVLVLLVVGAGALLGPRLRSPAQAAAEAAPPAPSAVTAKATRRQLSEPVVLRGLLQPGRSVKVLPPAAALGPNSVVTRVSVKKGDRLTEGRVVLERAGEPMFVLDLAFPLYRDVTAGMTGPDVAEIQRALRRLGYRLSVTSAFDGATQQQVAQFYRDRGYPGGPGGPDAAGASTPATANPPADAKNRSQGTVPAVAGWIPQAAVLTADRAGRAITAVHVHVGQVLTESAAALLELDGEAPDVVAIADRDQAALLHTGQNATVVDDLTGEKATAAISAVGKEPVTGADGQNGFQVRVRFIGKAIGGGVDRSLRLDVATGSGNGVVLAVPVTAIYSRADGSTFVTVLSATGTRADVTVTTGQIAGGWVEISESVGTPLTEGTQVVVGDQASG
ncbi:peptidoglycan-binding protein [Actinoplanes sp. KI2]|uniref:peptidoglycan-binding protein n=1 Tax=Actinoplanes sp. KI2 TaxID=2983315 RepID=UPI0021D5EFF7|nr:peptidoglycan-binding domain-containing protein [Actinoplanes sp. KI2]MCU7724314.1 peptidoglycan-binding protein [Actinoplanes sp. KI2]